MVLDVCSGSRSMWFDKDYKDAIFIDKRCETYTQCDGRSLVVQPTIKASFAALPFRDETFNLVVFDPPHIDNLGEHSWLAQKYGRLLPHWENEITEGFKETYRVLKQGGTLIFKWSEIRITVSKVLELCPYKPMFGHRSGRRNNTHWITFSKTNVKEAD